jgi:hypothetical protein
MKMQDILRRELNALFQSQGVDGLPESLSLEVKLDIQNEVFYLKDEQALFDALIHVRDRMKTYYHYTSFQALGEILRSGKIRFSSPAGLNDITEISSRNTKLKEELDGELDAARLDFITRRFIFSLTDHYDSLTQWRLYGADGTGVCLGLNLSGLPPEKNLKFGRILYGGTVAAALGRIRKRIADELQKSFDFRHYQSWGYFIKDNDYAEESEYRMVLYDDNDELTDRESWRINNYGAFYPYRDMDLAGLNLELETILLGPKFRERSLNRSMMAHYLERFYKDWNVKIEFSSIKSYR